VADHYVVDIDISDPVVDAGDWRLSVGGLVEQRLKLSFDELQRRFELTNEYSVLTCISNKVGGPLVGNSRWTGVRLRDVLAKAGVGSGAVGVAFRCADGYSVAIPLERARHPSVLLAIAQNGEPLTREHGFPCRVRVPALYGMMNAKWLESIEVVDHHFEGYWQQQGWSDVGIVRTESRIDTPSEARQGRTTWIAGVAWAGERGISAVDVSLDGGRTWRRAKLHKPISPLAWTQWAHPWTPSRPGRYSIACRATDGAGQRQDMTTRPPHPSGASGFHEVEIKVT
jgi:DMSO/TMAO reductase YedYZ molybdopterin-dependent catalytic subunit